MENYSLLYSSGQRTRLLSGFQRLRSQNLMCDVVLEAGGGRFPCHRALLAASSDYFWALFGSATAEASARSVSLPALTAEGLDAVLDFLYSGWLRLQDDTLPAVLEAARYLQVAPAVSVCEGFISEGLRVDNCCYYANLAELHALPDALEAAHRTITREMGPLLGRHQDRAGLLGLNVRSLMAVLDADGLVGVEERDLLQLALDWLSSNGPVPPLRSNLLLSRLRFGLVAPADLAALGRAHPAMATPLVRSQLTRAMEYHALGPAQPLRQSRQTRPRGAGALALLVGGGPSPERPERLVLAFDLTSRTFSPVSPALPLRLRGHCVCSVGGFLFVLGGEELAGEGEGGGGDEDGDPVKPAAAAPSNQVWRYDPRFRRWQQMAPLLEGRAQFSCCAADGVIYALGGRRAGPGGAATASVEFCDLAAGSWRKGPPMPRPLHRHAAALLGSTIYVSGGLQGGAEGGGSRDFLSWDPSGGSWARKAPMSAGRFGHRLAAACGRVYALLGVSEPFSEIERYEPGADRWTALRPLPGGCFGYGLVVAPAGRLLLFGGQRWSGGRRVTGRGVLEYDTQRDAWREVGQMPRPLTGAECTLLALPENS